MNQLEKDLQNSFQIGLKAFGHMFNTWAADTELSEPERIGELRKDMESGQVIVRVNLSLNLDGKPSVMFYEYRKGAELKRLFAVHGRTYMTN